MSRFFRFRRAAQACAVLSLLIPATAISASTSGAAGAQPLNGMSFMTVAQGAAMGIYPNSGPSGVSESYGYTHTLITPDNASGTNQAVSIAITGQKLFVQTWNTTAYFAIGAETFAVFWVNGSPFHTSPSFFVPSGDTAYVDWTPDLYFANNTQVCNTWFSDNGRPCETIHS